MLRPWSLLAATEGRRRAPALLALLAATVIPLAAGCDTGDGKTLRPPTSDQRAAMPTTTTTTPTSLGGASVLPGAGAGDPGATSTPVTGSLSLAAPWADGGAIDIRFTCDGANLSPLLTWTAPPPGTVELALLVTDDDAAGYVHWVVAGIPPTAGEKSEGATIAGAVEGVNDSGVSGWSGPCPPAGGPHTYRFTMYALGQQAELPDGFTGADLAAIAAPAATAIAELTGTYTRAG